MRDQSTTGRSTRTLAASMRFGISVAALLCLPSIGTALADAALSQDRPAVRLTLGGVEWAIPRDNLNENIPWYIRAIPGLRDDSNQVMVTFPVASWKLLLPGLLESESYDGVLTALTSNDEVARAIGFERSRAQEIWQGEGIFHGALVEPVERLGLVRVYDRYFAQSREMWQLVESTPQHDAATPAELSTYRVGSCMRMGPSSNRVSSCLTRFYVDQAYVDLYIPEADLRWRRQIGDFVAERIRSWQGAAN